MADTLSINGLSLNATQAVAAGTVKYTVTRDSPIILQPDQDVTVRGGPDSDSWQAGRVVRRSRGVDLTVYCQAVTGGAAALGQGEALLDAALATYPGEMLWQPDGLGTTWRLELPGPLSAGAGEYAWIRQKQAASMRRITGSAAPYFTATSVTTLSPTAPTNGALTSLNILGEVPPALTVTATATNLRAVALALTSDPTTALSAVSATITTNLTVSIGWPTPRLAFLKCRASTAGTSILNVYDTFRGLQGRIEVTHTTDRYRRLPGLLGGGQGGRSTVSGGLYFELVSGPSVVISELIGVPVNETTISVDDVVDPSAGTVISPVVADEQGVTYTSGGAVKFVPSSYTFTNGASVSRTGTALSRPIGIPADLLSASFVYLVVVASDQTFDDRSSASAHSAGLSAITVAYRRTEWWPA